MFFPGKSFNAVYSGEKALLGSWPTKNEIIKESFWLMLVWTNSNKGKKKKALSLSLIKCKKEEKITKGSKDRKSVV